MPFIPLVHLIRAGLHAYMYYSDTQDEAKEKERTIKLLAESHPGGDAILGRGGTLPVAFISYAFDDADLADEVKEFLEKSDLKIAAEKLESQSLLGRHDLGKELFDHVERSTVFIPLCTYSGNRSGWVEKEVNRALECASNKGLPRIVPVVIDEEGLFESLRGVPYIIAKGGFTRRVQQELRQYIARFSPK
jgi:hypothetical protein